MLTASGCAGFGRELAPFVDLASLGAFVHAVADACSRGPAGRRRGWPRRRPGCSAPSDCRTRAWTRSSPTSLPWLVERGARVLVSLAGEHSDEFATLRPRGCAGRPGVVGLEVNLGCADLESRGKSFAADPIACTRIVGSVRRAADPGVPVFVKLGPGRHRHRPHRPRLRGFGGRRVHARQHRRRARRRPRHAGAGADRRRRRAVRARAAAARAALRVAGAARRAVPADHRVPAASRNGRDALQFVLAGASAVAVGTAVFRDPAAPVAGGRRAGRRAHRPRLQRRSAEAVGVAHRTRHRRDGREQPSAPGSTPPWTPAARCASASTRTRPCSSRGGWPPTSTGWPAFAVTCVAAFGDLAAVIKPQSAFFEAYGSGGHRGPREHDRGGPRGRRAGAARRQAGRHRHDHGRLRRGLPRPGVVARRGRDHAQPVPRRRRARAGVRAVRTARRGGLRAGPHVEPRGAAVAERASRRRAHRRADRSSTTSPRATPAPRRSGRSASSSAPRSARTDAGLRRPQRADPLARCRGAGRYRARTCGGCSATPGGTWCPACRARCCATGPDLAGLRGAVERLVEEFAFLRG